MYPSFPYPLPDPSRAKKAVEEAWILRCEADRPLSYRNFRLFHETGSRLEYEREYMEHRKRLCAFTAAVLAGEDLDCFLPALCDTVFAICDEYTWALPAHLAADSKPKEIVERIDLFAAETAMALSELYAAAGHLLPDAVKERILYELSRRTFTPYAEKLPPFGHNNWGAVCSCGVGCSLLATKNYALFEKVKDNLHRNLSDFLEGIPDDGCCLEGSLYFAYGFGFFSYFADAWYEYSNGSFDLFAEPKVARLARFGINSFLSENFVIPFSDAPHTLTFEPGLYAILRKHYPDITPPDEKYASGFGDDVRYRFAPFIRNLYAPRTDEDKSKAEKRETVVYEKAGWFIAKGLSGGKSAFAAKAGHNDEPHNHNDIGSFVYLADGKFILDDLGWEIYKKGYFDPDRRYGGEFLCAASTSHSVPTVNGKAQKAGAEYAGTVLFSDENTFSIDLAAAYGIPTLRKLTRTFLLAENGFTLRDEFDGAKNFTERFVTRIEPNIDAKEGFAKISDFVLTPSVPCRLSVEKHTFTPRFSGKDGNESESENAYFIDFIPEEPCAEITFTLTPTLTKTEKTGEAHEI